MNTKRFGIGKGTAVWLAAFGMVFPLVQVGAQVPSPTVPPVPTTTQSAAIPDIELTAGGILTGRIADHTGKVLEGMQVTLSQGKNEIARVLTNKQGLYSFKNMRAGVYQITAGHTAGVFRVWAEKSAPPSAREHAVLLLGESGTPGKFAAVDPARVKLTDGVISAAVVSAILQNRLSELDVKGDSTPVTR